MQLSPQEIRQQFLNSIMEESGISLISINKCLEENKVEIDNMQQIFRSDDELSIKKRFVLLLLISRDMAKENVEYYREEIKLSEVSINTELIAADINTDIDKYKVLIITALMFNTRFYVSACNWRGLIRSEVNRITEMKKRVNLVAEGFAEYLDQEQKIIDSAKKYPCEKLSKTIKIYLANQLDTKGIISVLHNKKRIVIPYSGEMQNKTFTLWILEESREFEPIPINLQWDNKRQLRGKFEEEIPEMGKFILWAEKKQTFYIVDAKTPDIVDVILTQIEEREAAASKKTVFTKFFEHNITYKGISGMLSFMGKNKNQFYLEFVFDKYQNIIPFELKVHFRTKQDHKLHVIKLSIRKNEGGKSYIRSDIKNGVYYSKGIEGVGNK